jgi:hypothetical protein
MRILPRRLTQRDARGVRRRKPMRFGYFTTKVAKDYGIHYPLNFLTSWSSYYYVFEFARLAQICRRREIAEFLHKSDLTTKSPERQSRNQIGLSRAKLAKTAKLRD